MLGPRRHGELVASRYRSHPVGSLIRRVVHVVVSPRFAGVERYLCYTASEQSKRGLEVVVLGGDPSGMKAGLTGTGVEHRAAANPLSGLVELLRLRQVDVLHAHMTNAEVVSALAKPRLRCRLVVTRHFARRRGSTAVAQLTGRVASRSIDRQVAISEYVARHVEGPSDVVLSGVPSVDFEAEPDHDRPFVLVAQRMEPEKDGHLVLRAWAAAGLGSQGWHMVFAGDGRQRCVLERLASDLGVAPSVDFLGFVRDVHQVMDKASIFLASAPREPFGLSVVEAMARGVPVVAAAGGGHLETVGRARPDCLYPPGDVDAAADRLTSLANDRELRVVCGQTMRLFQQAKLSVETHVDGLQRVYAETDPSGRRSLAR